MDGPAGPVLEWPWDAWSLVVHRRIAAMHFNQMDAIAEEEARASSPGSLHLPRGLR